MNKLWRYLTDSSYRFLVNNSLGMYRSLSDEELLVKVYHARLNKELHLDAPVTFNEKLQWLKLYDRNPAYTQMVDKAAVKLYVAGIIGEEHIIPTLGIYNSFDEIDFSALPERFVLKCTHDSGGLVICRDKRSFDKSNAKRTLTRFLKRDYYYQWREWPYKNVPKKIIAEQYLAVEEGGLTDYKIHCFNGEPRLILVCRDRFSAGGMTEDFFTADWEHLALRRPGIRQSAENIEKPPQLEQMLMLAKQLSNNIPFARIDFYIVDENILFSEITLYPASGLTAFEPDEWDKTLGDWLTLPKYTS